MDRRAADRTLRLGPGRLPALLPTRSTVRADLVVGRVEIDRPFCGKALETGCLTPLDTLVDEQTLEVLAADAIGPSHISYAYGGHQWGLATDAACQVSAAALGHDPPSTWDEALALAAELGGRTVVPLAPAHSISSFLTLVAGAGGEPAADGRIADSEVGNWALEVLARFVASGLDAMVEWEPPT